MNNIDIANSECPNTKATNFSCVLAYLIRKADPTNLKKLYKAFPEEVVMVCEYWGEPWKTEFLRAKATVSPVKHKTKTVSQKTKDETPVKHLDCPSVIIPAPIEVKTDIVQVIKNQLPADKQEAFAAGYYLAKLLEVSAA